jgi:hypothetical protein
LRIEKKSTTDERSAAEPQTNKLNELQGLHKLHEVKEFARAAQILTDSSADEHRLHSKDLGCFPRMAAKT